MRRIAVINQKGGVGKTTTCANLGAALAEQGRRVVLVDMDAQANLTLALGQDASGEGATSYSVLVGRARLADALRPTEHEGLQLVPSSIDLSGAELELASAMGREFVLRDAVREWEEQHRAAHGRAPADYVLFDCPPSLGLLAINALAAASEVLIAIQTEFLALQGMSKLVEIVQLLRRRLNPDLEITGILPCLHDARLKLAREVLAEIRKYFPGQVLEQPIHTCVKLAEAPSFGQTILRYAPDSHGARDYRRAARAILRSEARDPELAGLPAYRDPDAAPAQPPPARRTRRRGSDGRFQPRAASRATPEAARQAETPAPPDVLVPAPKPERAAAPPRPAWRRSGFSSLPPDAFEILANEKDGGS